MIQFGYNTCTINTFFFLHLGLNNNNYNNNFNYNNNYTPTMNRPISTRNGPMWSRDENGLFWLVFRNKHGLTIEKIKEIFSFFGNVMTVTAAGDEKGYRFVAYGLMDEAELAVKSLSNHPSIEFFPHRPRPKIAKNINPQEQSNHLTSIEEIKTHSNFFQRKSITGNNTPTNNFINEEEPSMFGREFDLREKKAFENFEDSVFKEADLKKKTAESDEENPFIDLPNSNKQSVQSDTNTKTKLPKFNVINADEVIVANIPEGYGCAYILHLFDKYNPIAISNINVTQNNIRYCHVYFTCIMDGIGVQKKLDNYCLNDTNLVVLRAQNLIPRIKTRF